jgi:3-oxoacyl-[acyl-carrier-protein] synthase II
MMRRVAITGRAVVSPLAVGIDAHWQALVDGRCAVAPLPRLAALDLDVTRGAAVPADLIQPHLARLPRKQQKLYNRATLLGMLAASLAMEDAGLEGGAGDPRRFGVLLGVNALSWELSAMTQYLVACESRERPDTLDMALANSFCMKNINPLDYSLKTLPNLAAGHLAIAHDAQGLCRAMTEGPVGGARAVGQAFRLVQEGDLDVALCGGTDAQLEELFFTTYAGAGLLASDGGARGGFVPGEGSGILVLEELERARARGATIHAEVLGYAAAAGDGTLVADAGAAPDVERVARVIQAAIEETGALPDLVSVHGDGSPAHDRVEDAALRGLFGDRPALPVLRTKTLHGDLGAASCPVELLTAVAALGAPALPAAIASGVAAWPPSPRRALVIALGLFGESATLMVGTPAMAA